MVTFFREGNTNQSSSRVGMIKNRINPAVTLILSAVFPWSGAGEGFGKRGCNSARSIYIFAMGQGRAQSVGRAASSSSDVAMFRSITGFRSVVADFFTHATATLPLYKKRVVPAFPFCFHTLKTDQLCVSQSLNPALPFLSMTSRFSSLTRPADLDRVKQKGTGNHISYRQI